MVSEVKIPLIFPVEILIKSLKINNKNKTTNI